MRACPALAGCCVDVPSYRNPPEVPRVAGGDGNPLVVPIDFQNWRIRGTRNITAEVTMKP